ncbi:MAG: hypothetical protein ACI33P_08520 [Lysinibacillus sp.]
MGKGRTLLISGVITICFVTIGAVALLWMSEENPLEKLFEKEETMAKSASLVDVPLEETVEKQEEEESYIGIRTTTDGTGVHDVLFESGEVAYSAASGPMKLTVRQVRLEQLIPANKKIKNSVGGLDRATLVVLEIEVENQGGKSVIFRIDDTKAKTDTKESSLFHPGLSDLFGSEFGPNEKKKGHVVMDFESEPRGIAAIELEVASPYDENYDALGKAVTLKIPMY